MSRATGPRAAAVAAVLAGLLAAAGLPAQPAAVWTELVRLTAADGRLTSGLLQAPVGRAPRAGVVLVHGYASNFYAEPVAPLARGLAARGFLTLAVNTRDHDAGPKTHRFEEGRWDVRAAADELARRGAAPLAVVGSSLGTNLVLYDAAEAQDPRIAALVLLAPVGNAYAWNVRQFGAEPAARVLAEAERLRREGRGTELMVVDLGPLGKALYSADHLVSLRGPQTLSDPARNLARVARPLLLVAAGDDRLVDPATPRRLAAAATAAPRVDVVEIAGADHAFTRHADALLDAVERWLGAVVGR